MSIAAVTLLFLLATATPIVVDAASSADSPTPAADGDGEVRSGHERQPPIHWAESNEIQELTEANFATTIDETHLRHERARNVDAAHVAPATWIVMFYAPWCQHCAKMKPIFINASHVVEAESERHADNVERTKNGKPQDQVRMGARFALIDATSQKNIAGAFKVTSYPTFAYIVNRKLYLHDHVRTQEELVFLARYLYFGTLLGFINFQPSLPALYEASKTHRVTVWTHVRDAAADSPPLRSSAMLDELVAATLAVGHQFYYAWPYGLPMDAATRSRETATSPAALSAFVDKIEAAFAKASRGPNGEAVAVASDARVIDGVEPFAGEWDAAGNLGAAAPSWIRRGVVALPPVPPPAVGGDAPHEEHPIAVYQRKYISFRCPRAAAEFVEENSFHVVEFLTVENYAGLAGGPFAKRMWVIAAVSGVEQRILSEDRTTRQRVARRTLTKVVQRRVKKGNVASQVTGSLSPFRFVVVDSVQFYAALQEWVGFAKGEGGSGLFVYDESRKRMYVDEARFDPLIDETWDDVLHDDPSTSSSAEGAVNPPSPSAADFDQREERLVDAIEAFLLEIEADSVAWQPTHLIGKIATWIPMHKAIVEYLSITEEALVLIIGGGMILVVTLALAMRPYSDEAARDRQQIEEARKFWDSLTTEQKREYAKKVEERQRQREQERLAAQQRAGAAGGVEGSGKGDSKGSAAFVDADRRNDGEAKKLS